MQGRTIRYLNGGGLEVVSVDVPDPGFGEVQVQGGVCGICAWDLYTYAHGADAPSAAPPGHEGVGRVIKVGSGVEGIKEGDIVTGGGFATVRNVPMSRAFVVPDSGLDLAYWVIEPLSCVVTGVDTSYVQIGDRIALVGCGFMGLMLVQCLAQSFAQELIAVDVVPDRLRLASQFGADVVLNPMAEDYAERKAAVMARPIDRVVDASGAQAGLDEAVSLLKRSGHLNVFGWPHGQIQILGDRFHLQGYTVVFSAPAAKIRETFPVAINLIASGAVDTKPLVTHIVSLDEMGDLLARASAKEIPDYIKGVVRLD